MRRLIYVLLITLATTIAAHAQNPPDCIIQKATDLTSVRLGTYDNRTRACTSWAVVVTSTGFSAISVSFESASDSAGVAGAWSPFAGTVVEGVNPVTSTTEGTVSMTGFYPWLSINVSATGSGRITVTAIGSRAGGSSGINNALETGGNLDDIVTLLSTAVCPSSTTYDTNTNGKTELVPLETGKIIVVCGVSLVQSTTSSVTVSLGTGTGTNCGSSYTAKTPAWVMAGPAAAAMQGQILPNSSTPWFYTTISEALCISTNAAVSVQLLITYGKI